VLAYWSDYFVAQPGATAALAGLIFVALSFNFEIVLQDDVWLVRAASGLLLLAEPILSALVCLWPAPTWRSASCSQRSRGRSSPACFGSCSAPPADGRRPGARTFPSAW
jgi:hypothetical protein